MKLPPKINWDTYFMSMAWLVAMKSKDESSHYGTVIVDPDHSVVSTGYNSFCRGFAMDDSSKFQERPEKYYWFEHGERNAIYNAAKIGVSTEGCTAYVTGIPCMDCARALVQAGIAEVVMDDNFNDVARDKWKSVHERTIDLFNWCGVEHRVVTEYFKDIVLFIDGKIRKGIK